MIITCDEYISPHLDNVHKTGPPPLPIAKREEQTANNGSGRKTGRANPIRGTHQSQSSISSRGRHHKFKPRPVKRQQKNYSHSVSLNPRARV